MTDKFHIDDHKLMYHPKRVSEWLEDKLMYPLYLDISASGTCNHRCKFCCMDFRGYKPTFLDKDIFEKRINECGKLGIKAALFAGEGEPLLNKNLPEMINMTKNAGIDVALTTNGVYLNKEVVDKCLGNLSWIKVSCARGTKETHMEIHRSKPNDFDTIFNNLKYAIEVINKNNYKTVIGMQFLLLPENEHEIEILIEKVKTVGLKYLIIKPYSQSRFGISHIYENLNYDKYNGLNEKLEKYNDDNFYVAYRAESMKKWDDKSRGYEKCLSLPFACSIDCSGNVWGCCVHLGEQKLYYGNLYKNTFEEIWNSKEKKEAINWAETKLDLNMCQINCRMDKLNKYLWDLKHGIEHMNFI